MISAKKKASKKAAPKKKAASKKKAKDSSRATRADLARKIKKSRTYISQLVKKGVIEVGKDKKLDLKQSVKAYESYIDPAYSNRSSGKKENGFAKSRARTEDFKSKMAELDYLERNGELVSVKIVQKQQFEAARACRDALLSIPGRLSPELSGIEDRKEIERRLEAAIIEALERLSAE